MRFLLFFFTVFFLVATLEAQERFTNSDGYRNEKTLRDILKWSWSREEPKKEYIEIKEITDQKFFDNKSLYALWIGHSTFLINNGDITILFDPVFSERASPLPFAGPKRLIKPVIKIEDLPYIDVIAISHNHYDHFDINSLRKIQKRVPKVKILVRKGDFKVRRNC